MMCRSPVQNAKMDVGLCGLREALEEIFDKLGLEIADPGGGEFGFNHAEGTAAKVDGGCGESFVHGHQEVAGAMDAPLVAEGRENGFAKRDTDVFDGVVLIHFEVAGGLHPQVEAAV